MTRKLIENTNNCPITHTMNIIGNKWTPIIIYLLYDRKLRFGEMVKKMSKISRKVLSEQLKEMEKNGLVIRQAFAEIPPRVEYSLTEKAKELLPVLDQLCNWGSDIELNY